MAHAYQAAGGINRTTTADIKPAFLRLCDCLTGSAQAHPLYILKLSNGNSGIANPMNFPADNASASVWPERLSVNRVFLICDEPVSALDVSVQAQVLKLLEDMKQRYGGHSPNEHHVAVMYLGTRCESTSTADRCHN